MGKSVGLVIAKKTSTRLPNKNSLDFHGEPMFMVNVKKCLKIFDETYVSSDDKEMLKLAENAGAIPILRGEDLCGETPNIPVYQDALGHMDDPDFIVAVQANSPRVESNLIAMVKKIMEMGASETMTCHSTYNIYGSIWALTSKKLKYYFDPYDPKPDVLVMDTSEDIHTQEDYDRCIGNYHELQQ